MLEAFHFPPNGKEGLCGANCLSSIRGPFKSNRLSQTFNFRDSWFASLLLNHGDPSKDIVLMCGDMGVDFIESKVFDWKSGTRFLRTLSFTCGSLDVHATMNTCNYDCTHCFSFTHPLVCHAFSDSL